MVTARVRTSCSGKAGRCKLAVFRRSKRIHEDGTCPFLTRVWWEKKGEAHTHTHTYMQREAVIRNLAAEGFLLSAWIRPRPAPCEGVTLESVMMAVPEYNHSSSHLSYMLPRYYGSTAGRVQFVFDVMVACHAEGFSAACKMAPAHQERLTVSKSDLEACLLMRLPTEIPAAAEAEGTYCCARINGFISSGQQLKTRLVGCVHSRSGRITIHDTDKCTAVSSATPPVRNPYQSESIQLVLGMSFSWCLCGWLSRMVLRAAVDARYPGRLPGIGTRKFPVEEKNLLLWADTSQVTLGRSLT